MIINVKRLNKDRATYIEERFDVKSIYTDSIGNLSIVINGQTMPLTILEKDLVYFPEIDIILKNAD